MGHRLHLIYSFVSGLCIDSKCVFYLNGAEHLKGAEWQTTTFDYLFSYSYCSLLRTQSCLEKQLWCRGWGGQAEAQQAGTNGQES